MGAPNPYQRLYDRVKSALRREVDGGTFVVEYLSMVHLATPTHRHVNRRRQCLQSAAVSAKNCDSSIYWESFFTINGRR